MGKLTKHAEVLDQLHSMVKKQAAEAQKNISGVPGGDVKSVSVSDEHEHTNKNSVGPENVAQGYHQKPTEDPAEPLAGSKTANDLGMEILDIIRKQAEAQDTVSGKPGDVKSESVDDAKEKTNKNAVKPENNKQHYAQKGSTDSAEPLAGAKKAEVEELASKVASYELGRQFCAALLKSASDRYEVEEVTMYKEAGRRDFDAMIAQAAEELERNQSQEKQAFDAGSSYFDELVKSAEVNHIAAQNHQLTAKLAEYDDLLKQAADRIEQYDSFIKQAQFEYQQEQAYLAAQENQVKLAESVAGVVLNKLKSEIAGSPE